MTKLTTPYSSDIRCDLGCFTDVRCVIEDAVRLDAALSLIDRIADHDQSAFEEIYEKFQKYVFVIAKRWLKNEFEAEEVRQDVFLALWLRPPVVQHGLPSLIAWFAATTRKQCLMRMRRSQKAPCSQRLATEPAYSEGVVERIVETEKRVRLEKEFLHAPPKHREVLRLAYYEDMGATEIANHLGLRVITVRKRLDAATSRLHRHFRLEQNFAVVFSTLTPYLGTCHGLRA